MCICLSQSADGWVGDHQNTPLEWVADDIIGANGEYIPPEPLTAKEVEHRDFYTQTEYVKDTDSPKPWEPRKQKGQAFKVRPLPKPETHVRCRRLAQFGTVSLVRFETVERTVDEIDPMVSALDPLPKTVPRWYAPDYNAAVFAAHRIEQRVLPWLRPRIRPFFRNPS